jgi:hypothetical protein
MPRAGSKPVVPQTGELPVIKLYDRLLELISSAESKETMDLNQIYRRAMKIFS